ncbi:MAG: Aspartate aminotransferase [Spirochaetes bacterium ADurb.Bin218]|jgi:aspartate aminotransferase|nr:pyridoxal phosphate-dependent aminotransferase [Spirochaetota bacterium]OQA96048.1 MAG: Aspartate aminotransferase [Spirochaetes bacterium ADurb.Bin218]HOQ11274.1 pyridoxal phosphate-dependent aminotransferase [Spirochaetota bacterium]HOV07562.1 pyridoxal phosphate-dependent aminotransferase [Spirochaetota bacterium]
MTVSTKIKESIERSSWIRKMFEEGAKLKSQFGAENVFDFSLGNPDLDPPEAFFEVLKKMSLEKKPGVHGYMPNAGFPYVRDAIAKKISREQEVTITGNSIIMTCGAAGGMNVALKTILDPGDEVIVLKPFFAEYGFYISNHNGLMVQVDTAKDFSIDIEAIQRAITEKTRAIIINSPNNPTGKIYSESEIESLCKLLDSKKPGGRPIFLIADEPYREIAYDGKTVSPILSKYKNAIVINSYSKSLSLPGERIGYIAISPNMEEHDLIMAGLNLCNRILGFVNAPAMMQRIVAELTDSSVAVDIYKKRRDIFAKGLREAGYSFADPEGAFYLFVKTPTEDDVAFIGHLQKFNILAVPGVGFGGPGYMRLAYCVHESVIEKSLPKFKEALETFK